MRSMASRSGAWMQRLRAPAAAVLLALGASALPAHAGLFDDEEARRAILDLRSRVDQANEQSRQRDADLAAQIANQVTSQQGAVTEQLTQLRRSLLELSNQIELLRTDNARLRGQNEQLMRDVAEVQRAQRDIRQGVEDRLRQFEPQTVTLDGREIQVDPEERKAYDAAMALIRASDFSGAATSLTNFQQRWPASGYKESVLYWLGNAQYARRDCPAAMTVFNRLVSTAPQHARAPEAMLSIANCHSELKDGKAARKTLEDLVKAYPRSEAAVAARERLVAMK
jgi:tol-pal system protein YbgF